MSPLGWLRLDIDERANHANASTISRRTSRVRVAVEATNEEWMAAHEALARLRAVEDECATASSHT